MEYDVVIIGSGPAGTEAGKVLGSRGFRTAIIDSRNEIGNPIRCEELTERSTLDFLKVSDLENIMSNTFQNIHLSFKGGVNDLTVRLKDDKFAVFERDKFDKENTARAALNGCDVFIRTLYVGHYRGENGKIVVNVRRGNQDIQYTCRFLLMATGDSGNCGNLQYKIKVISHRVFMAEKYSTECRISLDMDTPMKVAWYIPKRYPEANMGIAAVSDGLYSWDPEPELKLFMKSITGEEKYFSTYSFSWETVSPKKPRTIVDGMAFAGDAACLRDPLILSGFDRSIISGNMAGEAIGNYLDGTDMEAISLYNSRISDMFLLKNRKVYDLLKRSKGEIVEKFRYIQGEITLQDLSSYALLSSILKLEL